MFIYSHTHTQPVCVSMCVKNAVIFRVILLSADMKDINGCSLYIPPYLKLKASLDIHTGQNSIMGLVANNVCLL